MRRANSHERPLSPVIIQVFGGAIVLAVLAYGFVTKDATIVLAVLGFGGGCVMIGGYYERANHDVSKALERPQAEPVDLSIRETDT